jgi:uncharacterized membrane protein
MNSRVKLFGHPIHPMLVGFPLAFYTAAVAAFLLYQLNGELFWFRVGHVANKAGVAMAIIAAVPGLLDWLLSIPRGTAAHRIGLRHLLLNLAALVLFSLTGILNAGKWDETGADIRIALVLALVGLGLTIAAGFHGWTLVQHHHTGIQAVAEPPHKR